MVVLYVLSAEAVCSGTDYYIDAESGNDANGGTSAGAAWRTIAKVNARTFAPGDRVLFKRGQLWREQLIVPSSGTSGNPITFGTYGTGGRAVLKGSALVTGWTSAGANQWRAALTLTPNQVFFSGTRGTKVSGTASVNSALKWYWSGGVLYVYGTANPGTTIEASVRPSTRSYGLVHIQGREYVNIEGLEITQSASFGLYVKPAARYITIRDCDISHALDGGLVVPTGSTSAQQITVEDSLVHHNNGGYKEGAPGVATYHEGLTMENVDGFTIRRTKVYSNYMEGSNFKRGSRNGVLEYCDLYANALINQYIEGATNIVIRYNRIYDCSYNAGIEFGMETNTYHNDNVRICGNLFWNNSGGVSFWAGNFTGQHRNIRIENNTFYNNWEAIRWKSGATDNYSGTNYIRNNVLWQAKASNRAIWDYTTGSQAISRTIISNNVFQQGCATATTGTSARVIADASFTNAASLDFRLRSGSPCIDAGLAVGMTADIMGTPIPQGGGPDIGAYEYGSGTTPSPTTYTLSTSASNGTVARTPNQTSYTAGETVTLQAAPNSGYTFTGWSGSLSGSANPASLVMDANKSVTAGFAAEAYVLTVAGANGSVARSPDQATYPYGEQVTLQATPDRGYRFSGWSGDLSGAGNPANLTMDSDKSVTASFAVETYTLAVNSTNGVVTRSPDKMSYAFDEAVTLRAVADAGYTFAGWSGDVSGTSNSVTITMDSDKTVAANFTSIISDGQPPVLAQCMPAADSIQAPRNTLVTLHVCDEGRGVDPASVEIRVNGNLVYTGNVDCCSTALGICQRSGTAADYAYAYQPFTPFRHGTQVSVAVDARDRAGNLMPRQTYSFATQMYSFGRNQGVSADQASLSQGKPAVVGDSQGSIWIAWHAGETGHRHVYVTCLMSRTGTCAGAMPVSQGPGDHCNPAVAVDDAGVVYVVWQENARGTWELCLSASADGQSWSVPKRISDDVDSQGGPSCNQVNPAIAAARGKSGPVAVAWQDDRAGNQAIYVATSSDRFATVDISQVTSHAADQTEPAVAIDSEGEVIVLWTDARDGLTGIYGAASDDGPWTNRRIVDADGGPSQPAVAAGSSGRVLHMVWTGDAGGGRDIFYATSEGLPAGPVAGSSIIDDTSAADQQHPTITAAAQADGPDVVFACWEDSRNRAYSGDTDLYFADLSPGSLRTNVLVDDRGTNSDQHDAALATDDAGYPYIVWAGGMSSQSRVYCSGAAYADPQSLAETQIAAASAGTIVGVPPGSIAGLADVSILIPAQACSLDARISISAIRNPQGTAAQSLCGYEFGPSGLTFAQPVTITIPYGTGNAAGVRACWFDCTTGTFREQGITDVRSFQVRSDLYALQFKATHFTPYYVMSGENADLSGGGSGGGCSLARGVKGNAASYFAPYLALAAIMIALRRRDHRRRRPPRPVHSSQDHRPAALDDATSRLHDLSCTPYDSRSASWPRTPVVV